MTRSLPTAQALVEQALASPHTVVAVEVPYQGSRRHPEKEAWQRWVSVNVVVEAPGSTHSLYRSDELASCIADTPAQLNAVVTRASQVAEKLGVPFAQGDVDQYGSYYGGDWIKQQGAAPVIQWKVHWQGEWWSLEGSPQSAEGLIEVKANSGARAVSKACSKKAKEISSDDKWPYLVRTRIDGLPDTSGYSGDGTWPSAVPHKRVIRSWIREGEPPSAVLRVLRSEPKLCTLERMVVFASAFHLSIQQTEIIAEWEQADLADRDLNRKLGELIESRAVRWVGPHRIRAAIRSGRSPSAVLRDMYANGLGMIQLILIVREITGMGLGEAKSCVGSLCGNPKADPEVDATLRERVTEI